MTRALSPYSRNCGLHGLSAVGWQVRNGPWTAGSGMRRANYITVQTAGVHQTWTEADPVYAVSRYDRCRSPGGESALKHLSRPARLDDLQSPGHAAPRCCRCSIYTRMNDHEWPRVPGRLQAGDIGAAGCIARPPAWVGTWLPLKQRRALGSELSMLPVHEPPFSVTAGLYEARNF